MLLSPSSAISIIAFTVPLCLLCLLCLCLLVGLRYISRLSPGLLPHWAKRVVKSQAYQALRWHLSSWGLVDVRTIQLLLVGQLAAGLVCFFIAPPPSVATSSNSTTCRVYTSDAADDRIRV